MGDADLSSAFGARLSTLQMEAQAQDGNILTGAELALMCYKKCPPRPPPLPAAARVDRAWR